MSYIRYKTVDFGAAYAGLGTVGYTLIAPDGTITQARTTAGVGAGPAASGVYGARVAFPEGFTGLLYWDTTDGSAVSAGEEINPGDDVAMALDNQGYTADRADRLDALDQPVSTRLSGPRGVMTT